MSCAYTDAVPATQAACGPVGGERGACAQGIRLTHGEVAILVCEDAPLLYRGADFDLPTVAAWRVGLAVWEAPTSPFGSCCLSPCSLVIDKSWSEKVLDPAT